jgi:hypothetical protein
VGVEIVRHRTRTWNRAQSLVVCGYLVAAFALNWRLWAGLGTTTAAGDPGPADGDLFAWFMRYAADAIAHGHLPALVTTALNAPRGINLMWNTSFLFPSVVLTPVTLLAGPQVSLTIMLTLGYAGSAASMLWLLRRLGTSVPAAALGGAVYGFSPALLDSGISHYNLQFAVLPPLIIEAVLRVLTSDGATGRGIRAGGWLGVLAAAQLFTEEEVLADTALAGAVLVVALAVSRPSSIRRNARTAALGLATAAATTLVTVLIIGGHALWIQFHGPLAEHGSPFPNARFTNSFASFVNPPGGLLFHTTQSAAYAASYPTGQWEYLAYLGWPLLALTVVAIIRYWRDLRIRAAGVIWVALELLSLGGNATLLPFHWLQGLPLLVEMLPGRLSLVADGAAGAVLALALDQARSRAPLTASWQRRLVPVAGAVLAVLPLIPHPVQAAATPTVPAGWNAAFGQLRLPGDARVLVVPVPYAHQSAALRWQADTGVPRSLIGGWFIGPNMSGAAVTEFWGPPATTAAVLCLDALWAGSTPALTCAGTLRTALGYWRPAAIVAVTRPGTPLSRLLTGLLGPPAIQKGHVLAWRFNGVTS